MKLECLTALKEVVVELEAAIAKLEPYQQDDDFCYIWQDRLKAMRDSIQMAIGGSNQQ